MPTRGRKIRYFLLLTLSFSIFAEPVQYLKNVIPKDQPAILRTFPPTTAEQTEIGAGKFVIFTRECVGKDWDFIAGAWECIPSRPETPITKRVEFCHSSWYAQPLLTLVRDDSFGMFPRFITLQVDSADNYYKENLYDINFRTWSASCIWQGSRLGAFGVIGESIFSQSDRDWLLIDARTGKISESVPFTPIDVCDGYWMVRKIGETAGCWSYDINTRRFVARFQELDDAQSDYREVSISPDGKARACVLFPAPSGWRGGEIKGNLILQWDGKKDVSIPVEMQALAGSGVAIIPQGVGLKFVRDSEMQFRALKDDKRLERVWTVNLATASVTLATRTAKTAEESRTKLGGLPVPDYLQKDVKGLGHFGRTGLAPAFLIHLGILKKAPEYPHCDAGVSRDGRHILFRAKKGALADFYIYGDLQTKSTVKWKAPRELDRRDIAEFVWMETP
jgi:hypothetical protein